MKSFRVRVFTYESPRLYKEIHIDLSVVATIFLLFLIGWKYIAIIFSLFMIGSTIGKLVSIIEDMNRD